MRKNTMPRWLSMVVIGLVPMAAAACDVTLGGPEFSVREEKTFTVTGPAQLTLQTWDGSIEVRGWDRNEVRIEVEKRGADQAAVDLIKVKTGQAGNAITVEIPKPSPMETGGLRRSSSARLIVSAPLKTSLVARSGDGSIKIRRIAGTVDLDTDDGSISLDEVSGELKVRTGDGSIAGSDLGGHVAVKTGDGSIDLMGVLAGLTVETHDGSVEIVARRGSRPDRPWEITTGDGSIAMSVPEDFAAEIDAHSGDGRVIVEQGGSSASRDRKNKDDDSERSSVKASIGSGGQPVRLRTGSGRITVKAL